MMKMSGGVMTCCVALLLALTSVSAVQKKLDSIDDLKKINFGVSVPEHSLVLLHWFANIVEINLNYEIWLNFDLKREEYGSHHYGNFEGLLDPLPWGYRYYTIGNLYTDTSRQLPPYVRNTQDEYVEGNRDRIIIRVQEQNTGRGALQRVDQVYITQHYEHRRTYDPGHTYQITANLLRQIRQFSVSDLRNRYGRQNTWSNQLSYRPQSNRLQSNSTWQTSSTWQTNNRLESRQNDCGDCCRALAFCCALFVLLVVFALFFLNVYHKK